MVLWVMKWDINPDKLDSYAGWSQGAIASAIGAGGVVDGRLDGGVIGWSIIVYGASCRCCLLI